MPGPACRTACLALLLLGASSELKAEVDLGQMAALRAADRHDDAADLGLKGVLEQPWDHSLRYLVADSLERAGRLDEAAAQFSALQGTPLQGAAQGRLAALAGRTPARPAAPTVSAAPTRVAVAASAPAALPQPVAPSPVATPAQPPAPVPVRAAPLASTARPASTPTPVNQTARVTNVPSTTAPGSLATPRRLGAPASAPAQPRTLGAPPAPASTPATATAATTQPRRLGAPANAPAQPRTLGAPPAPASTPATATAAPTQPRRLGAPATASTPPRRLGAPATASTGPGRLSNPAAGTPAQPQRLSAPALPATPATSPATRPAATAQMSPSQRIDTLYAQGEYAEAGAQGLDLLANGPIDADLHLKIANSLTWSGKVRDGQAQYKALFESKVDRDARLGLANTQRWNGRVDLAMAGYQAVLDRYPEDSDALEGMKQSRFALAPRTTFGAEYTTDINPVERRGVTLGHRWHNDSGDTRYEIRFARYEDSVEFTPFVFGNQKRLPLLSVVGVDRQSLTGSVEMLAHPLQPQLTLSVQQQPDDNVVLGSARIKLHEWPVWLRAGRLDWGHEALAPRAGALDLFARHGGLEAVGEFGWGQLYGQVDYYGITDGNSVSAAQLRWTPAWRPLGARWRPLLGVEFRQAMRPAAEYWSPALGHGSAFAGLSGDWSRGRWDLYGSAQYGVPLLEESGTSWSVSLGGRYRIAEDLSLSFGLWGMSSVRDNAAYRARAANLQVEKVWR